MRTIEIDFEIHKAIENERRGFDEQPHLALRRLLGLAAPETSAPVVSPDANGRPWREGAVELPHGTEARMSYQRGSQAFSGRFEHGKLVVDAREFDTLSQAAKALCRTRQGGEPSLNGWNYWEVKPPGTSQWIPVDLLRKRKKSVF